MDVNSLKSVLRAALSKLYEEREAHLMTSYYFEDKGYSDPNYVLNPEEIERFESDQERLSKNEPLQYVTGVCHFYGHIFTVNDRVLIPRPETEELVYQTIQTIKASNKNHTILDIGTGSGCIIHSLAAALGQHHKYAAIDIDEGALSVAQDNSDIHDQFIDFKSINFLQNQEWLKLETPSIIVSNPPYISGSESKLMHNNVLKYEPHIALFSIDDPLLFYKKISEYANSILAEIEVLCEINEHLGKDTISVFKSNGASDIALLQDMQGKDRIIKAKFNKAV